MFVKYESEYTTLVSPRTYRQYKSPLNEQAFTKFDLIVTILGVELFKEIIKVVAFN